MLRYCSYCACMVESEGHAHTEKRCNTCSQIKKLDEFPPHTSSLDGHRHTCQACVDGQKKRDKQRAIDHKRERAEEKALLAAYGYWWKEELVDIGWEEGEGPEWILHRPGRNGKPIPRHEAIAEIRSLQAHHPGHPTTIWARDMQEMML